LAQRGVRRLGKEWILESKAFEACASADEAFATVDTLLRTINRIFTIYVSVFEPFRANTILAFDDGGKLVQRRGRTSIDVTVIGSAGIRELSATLGGDSLGSVLLACATTDRRVAEALALVESHAITWPQIYDVIEFLGGADEIAASALAPRADTVRIRRTANHYRHLGGKRGYPLPANPPRLREARSFATTLLKKWLYAQVQS
jgi:hypothetical protein